MRGKMAVAKDKPILGEGSEVSVRHERVSCFSPGEFACAVFSKKS
jgi:hypothetical protein